MIPRNPKRPFRSRHWFAARERPDMTALYTERYMAMGFTPEELRSGKPIIGIAQSGSELNPCNAIHLKLEARIKDGVRAAGGIPIAITPTKDPVNHAEVLTAAAVSWPSSNISATGMAIYKHRGGLASADELVGFIDFGGTVTSTGGTFSVAASSITLNTPTGA